MIVYRHVTTFGVTQQRWLSKISDLDVVEVGGRRVLVAATHLGGGITSFAIPDPGQPLVQLRSRAYLADFTYQGPPEVSLLSLGDRDLIHVGQMGGAANLGTSLRGDNGAMAPFGTLFKTGLGGHLTELGQVQTAQGQILFSAQHGSLALATHRLSSDGSVVQAGRAVLPVPQGSTDLSLDKMLQVVVDGQRVLVAISGNGNFISTHLMSDSGWLGPGMVHVAARGTGFDLPSDVEVAQFGGRSFVLMAAAGSSSLTVFRLTQDGRLTTVDHVIDEGTTRFQSATALETAVVGGRAFVFAGGADDGISVFTMLPDGRLLHLTTIADSDAFTLADVSDIEAVVQGGRITLFVSSSTETGITQLDFDPGPVGSTRTAGAGTVRGGTGGDLLVAGSATTRLQGGGGGDILVAGARPVILVGGAGGDVFVASQVQGRISILDFDAAEDRLDLSMLGNIRSIWQLRFVPTSSGVMILYGQTILDITTRDGRSLSIGDFSNALFPIAHYDLPEIDPIDISPGDTPSTEPTWHFGTVGADRLFGGAAPDLLMAGAGNDTVSGGAGNDTLRGEIGNDVLRGGDGKDDLDGGPGRDTLFGDAGPDLLRGNDDDDLVYGGDGDDTMHGGAGNDLLYGGAGNDRLSGDAGSDTLSGEDGNDLLEALFGSNRLLGGEGDDTLIAGAGADLLDGGGGRDSLRGGDGNDTLLGGLGHDTMWGEGGNDSLGGDDGDDQLSGGGGADKLAGGTGNDTLEGNADNDLLFGNEGDDLLSGGDGSDTLRGNQDADTMYGGTGDDFLFGGFGHDLLYGEDGNDRLFGESGDDLIFGGAGDDRLFGADGNDTMHGDDGNDYMIALAGANWLYGGAGNDTLTSGSGRDRLWGGDGNDALFGNGNDDQLDGGAGDDRLFGGAGRDTVTGGTGNDRMFGGLGDDRLISYAGNNLMYGGGGNDTLRAGGGADTLFGDNGNDILSGGANADLIRGGQGHDRLEGGQGFDTLDGGFGNDRLFGGMGKDRLFGGPGNDTLNGGVHNDTLFGGPGADLLRGEQGADWLFGREGNDTLVGGIGPDRLEGGAGRDVFRFLAVHDSRPGAADRIVDFRRGEDLLDLRPLDVDYTGSGGFSGGRSVRWQHVGAETHVFLDLDGDRQADMLIRMDGHLGLDGNDFLL
ncbi:M10 family metallopeptidase C-terminal domain-containing protein [Paracoccus beibuensis]|uniref:M10 family metallopeptidase C-terminal domain-containing protein n=1 Tax=Paracoccus beibuensis TaxID=547602 RepID=UPI002240C3DF|nr:M10 family metallopeptidase C-terminal domain-containing protein [Paracoccus beibuensis]